MKRFRALWIFLLLLPLLACETASDLLDEITYEESGEEILPQDEPESAAAEVDPPLPDEEESRLPEAPVLSKWDLWASGETLLRGANIWQGLVIPELDGPDFKGSSHVGPPYTQEDFDRLAEFGANYVTISGPGLFSETPPFEPDSEAVAHFDDLLQKIAAADLFATIAFRTGPGRSEYGLCCGGDSYFDDYFNDTVWEDPAAQEAWVEMWRYTAERYGDNPNVVGYKLMVEPNAEAIFFDVYEPSEFYPEYAGTSYDWNEFYPRIVDGIREVDQQTPILVGGMGFSGIRWLPYLEPVEDPRIVYVAHQYEPFDDYTHQLPGGRNSYPGSFDLDYDGEPDEFNREWLASLLSPLDQYAASNQAPIAVDEFSVNRWVPGGDLYMADLMDLMEQRGINHSIWEWQTSWPDFRNDVHDMDFRFGPDPDSRTEMENDLLEVITSYWQRNTVRPSNVSWEESQ